MKILDFFLVPDRVEKESVWNTTVISCLESTHRLEQTRMPGYAAKEYLGSWEARKQGMPYADEHQIWCVCIPWMMQVLALLE
jgi:hypothetical protein